MSKATFAIVAGVIVAIAAAFYFILNSRKDEGANPSGQPASSTPAPGSTPSPTSTPAPATSPTPAPTVLATVYQFAARSRTSYTAVKIDGQTLAYDSYRTLTAPAGKVMKITGQGYGALTIATDLVSRNNNYNELFGVKNEYGVKMRFTDVKGKVTEGDQITLGYDTPTANYNNVTGEFDLGTLELIPTNQLLKPSMEITLSTVDVSGYKVPVITYTPKPNLTQNPVQSYLVVDGAPYLYGVNTNGTYKYQWWSASDIASWGSKPWYGITKMKVVAYTVDPVWGEIGRLEKTITFNADKTITVT